MATEKQIQADVLRAKEGEKGRFSFAPLLAVTSVFILSLWGFDPGVAALIDLLFIIAMITLRDFLQGLKSLL